MIPILNGSEKVRVGVEAKTSVRQIPGGQGAGHPTLTQNGNRRMLSNAAMPTVAGKIGPGRPPDQLPDPPLLPRKKLITSLYS